MQPVSRSQFVIDSDKFMRLFGHLEDSQWLQLLIRSCSEHVIEGVQFPAFPEAHAQASFVGSSGAGALQEAYVFYQDIKAFAKKLNINIGPETKILDFGCGWGRNYRFFLKDVRPANLLGVDVDPACVELCKQGIAIGQFETCLAAPPLPFEPPSMDIVYAYSVFSHLSEAVHLAWIREFCRILRDGGMLIATTLKKAHLEVWNQVQSKAEHWRRALPDFDLEIKAAQFDRGDFLFCPIGGGGPRTSDFYGEAIISPAYLQRCWTPDMELIEYLDDPVGRPQALIVARRKSRIMEGTA